MNNKKRQEKRVMKTIERCIKEHKQPSEQANWTIITAMDHICQNVSGSSLSDKFWKEAEKPLSFLGEKLGLTDMQIVFLSLLAEAGEPLSWKKMGETLFCTRLTMMSYSDELERLIEKRWVIRQYSKFLNRELIEGYALEKGLLAAFKKNEVFVPEKIDGLTEQEFIDKLKSHLDRSLHERFVIFENEEEWMKQLIEANKKLPLCCRALGFKDIHVISLLLMVVYDYSQYADSDKEGLHLNTINLFYPEEWECDHLRKRLQDGSHVLIQEGLVEHKCEEGIAYSECYVLTSKAKEELLPSYKPFVPSNGGGIKKVGELRSFTQIIEKQLFYNPVEKIQIERLTNILSEEKYFHVHNRLLDAGLRTGLACLFYGAPGTGKTETVLQIARQTGRDIMQIDISRIRDKYVGESEKNTCAMFKRYRQLCRQSSVTPILFFNEADAIFGKRTSVGQNPSVEKMDNAMQNIILQEMETLDGILIATTNLTGNFDSAFERRFLFKVEFVNPEKEVKARIWMSIIDSLSEEDALLLASRYDFSGGQIENVARKVTIDRILYGQPVTLEQLDVYCREEAIHQTCCRKDIGFRI